MIYKARASVARGPRACVAIVAAASAAAVATLPSCVYLAWSAAERFPGQRLVYRHPSGCSSRRLFTSADVDFVPARPVEGLAAPVKWVQPVVTFGHAFQGGIPTGLRYCRDFITDEEEAELVTLLSEGHWLHNLKSRAQQFFGLVYYQTTHDLPSLQPADGKVEQQGRPLSELPSWLLPRVVDTGVFDRYGIDEVNQVAANEYLENVGIAPHVEDPSSFGPNLATLSLLEPVQFTLTPADHPQRTRDGVDDGNWAKVLLEPRSFLVLQNESRYAFKHSIRKSKLVTLADGSKVRRDSSYRRISLTFRELLESRRKLDGSEAAPSRTAVAS